MQTSTPDKSFSSQGKGQSVRSKRKDFSQIDFLDISINSKLSNSFTSENGKSRLSKDDFWDAISPNYDYLMDDGLIATCREASSDLSLDDEEELSKVHSWTFNAFITQFKHLHDMFHQLQVFIQGRKENSEYDDNKVMEEKKRLLKLYMHFNDQGLMLSKRYPDMKDEVNCHLNLLSNKWLAVEQAINPQKKPLHNDDIFSEINFKMKRLQFCLRKLDKRCCHIDVTLPWSIEALDEKYKEMEIYQNDIIDLTKHVTSLKKKCNSLDPKLKFGQISGVTWDSESVKQLVVNLEKRHQKLWLVSVENLCVIENLKCDLETTSPEIKLERSFSEEPVRKHPRLSQAGDYDLFLKKEYPESNVIYKSDYNEEDRQYERTKCFQPSCALIENKMAGTNDKGVMVGATGITELKKECGTGGKFEVVQDVGYSSETSVHFSNDEHPETANETGDSECKLQHSNHEGLTESLDFPSSIVRHLSSSSSSCLKTYLSLEKKLLNDPKYNTDSQDKFYRMTSLDSDTLVQCANAKNFENNDIFTENVVDQSSLPIDRKDEHCGPNLATSDMNVENVLDSHGSDIVCKKEEGIGRTERVQAWLNNHHKDDCEDLTLDNRNDFKKLVVTSKQDVAASSCDASAECTTTDSDGEKSAVSDGNNHSVSLSQSFSGSVETVIPISKEERFVHSDRAGSCEPSPTAVRMRKKKKPNRERPFSNSEVQQGSNSIVPTRFPHSTSEGALNSITQCSDYKQTTPRSKKMRLGNGNSSLTDVSVLSCPVRPVSSGSTYSSSESSGSGHSTRKATKRDDSALDVTLVSEIKNCSTTDGNDHQSPSLKSRTQGRHKRRLRSSQSETFMRNRSIKKEKPSIGCKTKQVYKSDDQSSDQLWDDYQDPQYPSESYSEAAPDEEQVKNLINFGDDYGATLGNPSDASSIIANLSIHKSIKTNAKRPYIPARMAAQENELNFGSDSDTDDFHNVVTSSKKAQQFVATCLYDNIGRDNFVLSAQFAGLVATCETNLCHLCQICEELAVKPNTELEPNSSNYMKILQDLIKEWNILQSRLKEEKSRKFVDEQNELPMDVQEAIAFLRRKLIHLERKAAINFQGGLSYKQLHSNIQTLQVTLGSLQDMKRDVISASARTLSLKSDVILSLKEDAAKLYQLWEDVYEFCSSQLTQLQELQACIKAYDGTDLDSFLESFLQQHILKSIGNKDAKADQYSCLATSIEQLELVQKELAKEGPGTKSMFKALFPFGGNKDEGKESAEVSKTKSKFWRALCASLPIQLVLVLTYCLSCYMAPQCCNDMNTLDFSFFPVIRHLRGPPPV